MIVLNDAPFQMPLAASDGLRWRRSLSVAIAFPAAAIRCSDLDRRDGTVMTAHRGEAMAYDRFSIKTARSNRQFLDGSSANTPKRSHL
jgi:hypothetical protein